MVICADKEITQPWFKRADLQFPGRLCIIKALNIASLQTTFSYLHCHLPPFLKTRSWMACDGAFWSVSFWECHLSSRRKVQTVYIEMKRKDKEKVTEGRYLHASLHWAIEIWFVGWDGKKEPPILFKAHESVSSRNAPFPIFPVTRWPSVIAFFDFLCVFKSFVLQCSPFAKRKEQRCINSLPSRNPQLLVNYWFIRQSFSQPSSHKWKWVGVVCVCVFDRPWWIRPCRVFFAAGVWATALLARPLFPWPHSKKPKGTDWETPVETLDFLDTQLG